MSKRRPDGRTALALERLQVLKLSVAARPDFPTHNAELW
jgi:hypothetical protein